MRWHDVACSALLLCAAAAGASAQQASLRASFRGYGFLRLQDRPGDSGSRHDAEFASLRLQPKLTLTPGLELDAHIVADAFAPAGAAAAGLATARTRTFLPLERAVRRTADYTVTVYADRLSARLHTGPADLVLGRQAITWGVNVLWPALDLFAPFSPLRIDRDYKPGVDAARLTLALGSRSEVQVVGAVLGDSLRRDWAGSVLLRVSTGPADLGVMAGSFHGDTVVGGFAAADLAGAVVRGELSWTLVGDPAERLRHRSFWRGGVGIERQLTSTLGLLAEVAANGNGTGNPGEYALRLAADRMQRGEAGGPGRWYLGGRLAWQWHPLASLTNSALFNLDDGSVAWVPWLDWSLTGASDLVLGAQLTFGADPGEGGVPRSEYGSCADRLLAGVRVHL